MSSSSAPSGLPPLRPCLLLEQVRVAWCALDDPRRVADGAAWLSAEEQERAARFRFARDRDRFVAARALLRSLLAAALDEHPARIAIVADASGKPRLARRDAPLRFNLSHTGDRALFAFTDGSELGVDVEAVRPMADMAGVAQRVFSRAELDEWRVLPELERPLGFFNGWTRKEAFVKALGRGLDYPLGSFDVSLAPGAPARLLRVGGEAGPPSRWALEAFSPEPGYVAAVVVERPLG